MLFFCFSLLFLVNIVSTASARAYGKITKTVSDLLVYTIFTGVIATFVFFALSKFQLEVNSATLLYGGVYAVVVVISLSVSIQLYKYISVAEISVFGGSFSQVLTFLSGMVILSEKFNPFTAASAALMCLATVIMFFSGRKKSDVENTESRNRFIGIMLCIVTALISVTSTLIIKSATSNPKITSTNSVFCLTNAFVAVISILALLIVKRFKIRTIISEFAKTEKKKYAFIAVNTIGQNITAVLNAFILATSAVSFYSPMSAAITFLSAQTLDIFISKKIQSPTALLFAAASLAIGFFGG